MVERITIRDDSSMQTITHSSTRRLERPSDSRILAGVAAGVADYLGVSALAVRLGLVALALLGGAAVPLYLTAWLLMPPTGGTSHAARWLGSLDRRAKQTAALVGGFLLLAAVVGYSPIIVAIAIVIGLVSYQLLAD